MSSNEAGKEFGFLEANELLREVNSNQTRWEGSSGSSTAAWRGLGLCKKRGSFERKVHSCISPGSFTGISETLTSLPASLGSSGVWNQVSPTPVRVGKGLEE